MAVTLLRGAKDLQRRLEKELCMKLSMDKCDLAASSTKAANAIRCKLGRLAGKPDGHAAATMLGIHVQAGCRRSKRQGCDSVRKQRMAKAKRRLGKVQRLWQVSKEAEKLISTGVLPSVSYGMEVTGVAPLALKQARSAMATYHGHLYLSRNIFEA